MSFYRDVYLKSEDWKNLRAAVLAIKSPDGKCYICEEVKPLDVHHSNYRKLYDVTVQDLWPLCRTCHDKVHALWEKHPKWSVGQRWARALHILKPETTAFARSIAALAAAERQCERAFKKIERLKEYMRHVRLTQCVRRSSRTNWKKHLLDQIPRLEALIEKHKIAQIALSACEVA